METRNNSIPKILPEVKPVFIEYDNPPVRGPGGGEFYDEIARRKYLESRSLAYENVDVSSEIRTGSSCVTDHRNEQHGEATYKSVNLPDPSSSPVEQNYGTSSSTPGRKRSLESQKYQKGTSNFGHSHRSSESFDQEGTGSEISIDHRYDNSKAYLTIEARENSFKDRRWRSSTKKPRHLAKAGFYFKPDSKSLALGVTTDSSTCFACDVELHDWTSNDSAFTEHERVNNYSKKECYYLKDDEYKLHAIYHNVGRKMVLMGFPKEDIESAKASSKSQGSRIRSEDQLLNKLLDKCIS